MLINYLLDCNAGVECDGCPFAHWDIGNPCAPGRDHCKILGYDIERGKRPHPSCPVAELIGLNG